MKQLKKAYNDAVAELKARHTAITAQFENVKSTYHVAVAEYKDFFEANKITLVPVAKADTQSIITDEPVLKEDHKEYDFLSYKTIKAYDLFKEYEFTRDASTSDKITDATIKGAIQRLNNDLKLLNGEIATFNALIDDRAEGLLETKINKLHKAYNEAFEKEELAAERLATAKTALDNARAAAVKAGADKAVIFEAEKLGDVTIITKETKTTTEKPKTETKTTETTTETVKPGKVEKGISAETRAKLQKAIDEAEQKILAVKFLKETTPKTISKVVDKLDKIVAEQEALIKSAKELLGQKAAFSLISTAYADDEKSAEEKAKELTDKLNENTAEIEKTLKENEANQGKEEKPADTKKPEEKPADTKKPAKRAGNNAKTGIAGVAGVAGILAAASVAYAASKRD